MRKIVFLYILIFQTSFTFSQEESKKETEYSHQPGFYSEEIELNIHSDNPDIKLFYTTDGSYPSSRSKKNKDKIKIKETTVVKVAVYLGGKRIQTQTQTYFVNTNHELPVVSISTTPDNLWGEEKGIYIEGCCASEFPPYRGANFWNNREVLANIEYFTEQKKSVINQEIGLRIFGGFTRSLEQKSLALIARKKHGSNKLDYPFFKTKPDLKEFKSVVLRNSGGDFNKSNFRDGLMTHLATETGLITQAFQPVVVYINGKYWGIQNLREKINEHFIEANFKVNKDSIDILRHRYDVQQGSSKEYHKLLKFLKENKFKSNDKIAELETKMDIDNYLNYHVSQIYFDNQDMSGNTRYWREKNSNGRWSWILFDTDLSFSISSRKGYKTNTLEQFTTYSEEKWPNPHWSTFIIRKLLENDSIKEAYINKTLNYLNTCFSPESVSKKIDSISKLIESEIPDHSKRWSRKPKYWHKTLEVMHQYAINRPIHLRNHLKQKFKLKDTCVIEIINNPNFGKVSFNGIYNIETFKGTYFIDRDYKISVLPNPDYEFTGWKNDVVPKDTESIKPLSNIMLEAEYIKKPLSNMFNLLIINELNVKGEKTDWVELLNTSKKAINLNGWTVHTKKSIDTIKSITIEPGEYLVLKEKGDLKKGISSKSDSVKIYDDKGLLVDAFYISNNSNPEQSFYALRSPYHDRLKQESWTYNYKKATPGEKNVFFKEMTQTENKFSFLLNIGGSIILTLGAVMLFLGIKKRPQETTSEKEN